MSATMAIENNTALDLRKIFEPKIQELNALAKEIAESGTKDQFGYLVPGISKLTSMMLDCDQYLIDIDPDGEPMLVDRVVKVNRYSNKVDLQMHGVDHVVVTALFMTVPMYLLPANKVKQARKNRFGAVLKPEEFGLPTTKECNYGTLKELSPTTYTALAVMEGNYANELITSVRHYENIYLK